MSNSCRSRLQGARVSATTHAGLWLDKYIPGYEMLDAGKPEKLLVDTVAGISTPAVYEKYYQRWAASLKQIGVVGKKAHVQGRLSIGLGGESVLETAISLHRTYGVPYIPGSALKGLAASYARNRLAESNWGKGSKYYPVMFGDTANAGYLTFFDALYVPGTGHNNGQALWPDVITVHHPEYYQGDKPPADWDSPTPIPFLSATGDYLIAIGGDVAWAEKAFEILAWALAEVGIGAKTSSGYGRMEIEGMASGSSHSDISAKPDAQPSNDPDVLTVQRFEQRLAQMPHAKVAGEIHAVYQAWQALEVGDQVKRAIAQAILDKIEKAGRTKNSVGRTWYQELQAHGIG